MFCTAVRGVTACAGRDGVHVDLREAPAADEALVYEAPHGAGDVLDGYGAVHAVEVVEFHAL